MLSASFVIGRLAFGHLPEKIGGTKVALACIVIEAVGQALIWGADGASTAIAGVALSGFGYALVYPGFGVEAERRAPAHSRGVATGAYTACLDLALGIGNPAMGVVARSWGVASVFGVSTIAVACALAVASPMLCTTLFATHVSDTGVYSGN